MKKIYSLLLCTAVLFSLVSCESNNGSNDGPGASNIYVLNSGSWNQANSSSLTSYDLELETTADDIFASQNGKGLGDTAQDMVVFGDKIFISVYGSGVIFVTDLTGKIKEEIKDDTYFYPRYLATDDDYVYVSYYDGAIAKIDPETYSVTKTAISTPGNPERVAVVNGKLYMAISDYGYGNEASVVAVYNTSTMELLSNIEVILNPTVLTADSQGNVYVISMGNYGYYTPEVYATLQKIDTDGNVSTISIAEEDGYLPVSIAMGNNNILYVMEGSGYPTTGDVYAYNTTTKVASKFITDGTTVSDLYMISTDLTTGEVYIGTSDYSNTGDLYVFNSDGTFKSSFGVGLNPMKAISVAVEE